MGFKLPEWFEEKKKEEYELKYIELDDAKIHVSEFKDKSITPEMKSRMRMNSYAREDLPPKLTDEALIETVEYYVSHCSTPRYPYTTYNEAIIHNLVPELVKRLKELQGLQEFYNYFAELYGKGLEIANWHMNGNLEPFDEFFEAAEQEMGIVEEKQVVDSLGEDYFKVSTDQFVSQGEMESELKRKFD